MKCIKKLLQEEITLEEKYNSFLETIKFLRQVEGYSGYRKIINEMLPTIERNVETFEKKKILQNDVQEYVQKYDLFFEGIPKISSMLSGSS